MSESKSELRAFLVSAGIHLLVFLLFALSGNFVVSKTKKPVEKPFDVVIYDVDAGAVKAERSDFAPVIGDGSEGGGGGGGGKAAPLDPPDVPKDAGDQVSLPDKTKPLVEDTSPYKKSDVNPAYNPPEDVNREEGGTGYGGSGTGIGGGHGSGIGTGTGSGIGPGEGSGSGGGSGSGHGSGTGSGTGVRPKVPPRLVSAVSPVYPETLRRKSIEGSVRVRIIVAADGSVESVSVAESSGYDEMDDAAESAAYNYQFSPAEDAEGNPVRCAISTNVIFQLN